MDQDFSAMSDPDFLAERRRVREELEHTQEHEVSTELSSRYQMLNEEFLRRASLACSSILVGSVQAHPVGEVGVQLPGSGEGAGHLEEAMDHARVAPQVRLRPGLAQHLGVAFAVVPQRVVFGGDDAGRGNITRGRAQQG